MLQNVGQGRLLYLIIIIITSSCSIHRAFSNDIFGVEDLIFFHVTAHEDFFRNRCDWCDYNNIYIIPYYYIGSENYHLHFIVVQIIMFDRTLYNIVCL